MWPWLTFAFILITPVTTKYVFQISIFFSFITCNKTYTAGGKRMWYSVLWNTAIQWFGIFFGTGIKVLTMVRMYNAVWVRTHSLVHANVLEENSGVCLHSPSDDKQYDPTENLGTHQLVYAVHNLEDYKFEACRDVECICNGRTGYFMVGDCVTAVMQRCLVRYHNSANFITRSDTCRLQVAHVPWFKASAAMLMLNMPYFRSLADGDVFDVSLHGDARR
jgi:hypothetical protein